MCSVGERGISNFEWRIACGRSQLNRKLQGWLWLALLVLGCVQFGCDRGREPDSKAALQVTQSDSLIAAMQERKGHSQQVDTLLHLTVSEWFGDPLEPPVGKGHQRLDSLMEYVSRSLNNESIANVKLAKITLYKRQFGTWGDMIEYLRREEIDSCKGRIGFSLELDDGRKRYSGIYFCERRAMMLSYHGSCCETHLWYPPGMKEGFVLYGDLPIKGRWKGMLRAAFLLDENGQAITALKRMGLSSRDEGVSEVYYEDKTSGELRAHVCSFSFPAQALTLDHVRHPERLQRTPPGCGEATAGRMSRHLRANMVWTDQGLMMPLERLKTDSTKTDNR
jgi:hypothetical protein